MIRFSKKFTMGAVIVAVVAGSAGVATAEFMQGGPSTADQKIDALKPYANQAYPLVRAAGANPEKAARRGTTASGVVVSTVAAPNARCVLRSDRTGFCATPDQVVNGQSLQVNNDCSKPGGAMSIIAVLPSTAVRADFVTSDGATMPMKVGGDAAWIETQTPADGIRAQIHVSDENGASLTPLLMPGDFCPGG